MSTVRIQVRRGTASQWDSVNPILAAGEMGLESDTNFIKFGNGTSHWDDLPYANDPTSFDLSNTLADYVLIADVGNAGGPAKLNADGNLLIPKSSIILEGSSDDAYETTITVANPTADQTITIPNATGTVALTSDLDAYATTEALNSVISSLNVHEAVAVATTEALSATYTAGTSDQHGGTGIGAKLTLNSNGVLVIDDYTVAIYDRVLVKNQANFLHNGIYELTTLGTPSVAAVLTRAADYDNSLVQSPGSIAQGDVVFVTDGNTNKYKQFAQKNEGSNTDKTVIIGTDTIEFVQSSGTATLKEGNGIVIEGDTISVNNTQFLSVSSAAQTYLTQANASSTYLTQANADSGYLTKTAASSTYLAKTDAENDYLSKTTASSTYLTQTNAATTYFAKNTDQIDNTNIKSGAAIAANKIAGTAVTQTDTGTVTNTMLAGSIANNKLEYSTISGKSLGSNLDTLTIGTGLTGTSYNGGSATTIAIDSTIATKTYADDAEQAAKDYADSLASNYEVAGAVSTHSSDTTNVHGISDTSKLVTTDGGQSISGTTTVANLEISGSLTFTGTATQIDSTNTTLADPMIYLGDGNSADIVDLGFVGAFDNGTYQHSGLVRDASDSTWKLFSGVTDEPTNTVNFGQGQLDNLAVGGIKFSDGTQTKEGVPSRTPIISKTADYTLTNLSERDSLIEVDSTDPVTITIPTNSAVAFPVGTTLDILGVNTGLITIAGDTGVTVNATPGLKLRTQWSSCTLFKRATNSWVVYGDLKS